GGRFDPLYAVLPREGAAPVARVCDSLGPFIHMIPLFKALLLVGLLVLGYPIVFRARLLLVQRIFGVLLGALLAVFVIFPDASTAIGRFFGIGRGADFLFYLAHLFLLYLV